MTEKSTWKKIKNDAFTCHMKIPLVLKFDWFFLQACTANCYIHVCSLSYSELREFDCFSLSRPVRRTAIFMSVVYFTTNFFSLTGSLSPGLCGVLLHHHPLSPVLPVSATALPAVRTVCPPQPVLQSGCVCLGFFTIHFSYRSDVSNTDSNIQRKVCLLI